jgi:hypothetical protein
VRREWDVEALIDSWTLYDADRELIDNKYGATKLGFCLLLKFFEIEGRFPRHAGEIPRVVVDFVAAQVGVDPAEFAGYDWSGRSIKNHRARIRAALGFREVTRGDQDKLTAWLAERVCPSELNTDAQREALLARCRADKVEPPGKLISDRIIGSANRAADERFCASTVARLSESTIAALEAVIGEDDGTEGADLEEDETEAGDADLGGGASFYAELKADPGPLGLETLLAEIRKLGRVHAIGLPADLFSDTADKRLARWRARAVAEYPSTLRRDHPREVRLTLLAVLCWCRLTEITDSLVELFIQLVHRINARAECGWTRSWWRSSGGWATRSRCCSGWPRPLWTIRMSGCGRRCTRWSVRAPCGIWWLRPRRPRVRVRRGCAPCWRVPIRITTGRCCPSCSTRLRSGATTPLIGQ